MPFICLAPCVLLATRTNRRAKLGSWLGARSILEQYTYVLALLAKRTAASMIKGRFFFERRAIGTEGVQYKSHELVCETKGH